METKAVLGGRFWVGTCYALAISIPMWAGIIYLIRVMVN